MPRKDPPKKQPTGRPRPRSYSTGELRRIRPQNISPVPRSTLRIPARRNPYPFPKPTEDSESPDDEDDESEESETPEVRTERRMWQTQNSFFERRYDDGAMGRVSGHNLPERPSDEYVHLVAGAHWNEEVFHVVLVTFGTPCFTVFEVEKTFDLVNHAWKAWLNTLKFEQEYPSFEGRVIAAAIDETTRMIAVETDQTNLLIVLSRLRGIDVELETSSPRRMYFGMLRHITDDDLIVLMAKFDSITGERTHFFPSEVATIRNVGRQILERKLWIPHLKSEQIDAFKTFVRSVFDDTPDGSQRLSLSSFVSKANSVHAQLFSRKTEVLQTKLLQRLHDEHPDLGARLRSQRTSEDAHPSEISRRIARYYREAGFKIASEDAHPSEIARRMAGYYREAKFKITSEDAHTSGMIPNTDPSEPRLERAMSMQQVDGVADQESIPQTPDNTEDSFLDSSDRAADQPSFALTSGDLDHLAEAEHQQSPAQIPVNVQDSLLGDSDRDQESHRHTLDNLESSSGDSGVEIDTADSKKQLGDFYQGMATPDSSSEQLQEEETQNSSSGTEEWEMIIVDSCGPGADADDWGADDDGKLDVEDFPTPPEIRDRDDADQSEEIYKASPPRRPPQEARPGNTATPHTALQVDGPSEVNHGKYITMTADDMTELSNVAGNLQLHSTVPEESTASSDTPGSVAESDDQERAIATPDKDLAGDTTLFNPRGPAKEQGSSDGDSEGSKSKKKRSKKNKKK